ncbi:MAG: SHOCT domain-containing protein [Deltaproteobacteria bacterium]|nr:SHOCT domain-containing protein [Deltaproteobacteria bacterium]
MMPWNMGWFGSILMFALWIGLFAVVFFLVKKWIQTSQKGSPDLPHRPSAMDILKERYARGEIDKEEFEEKKRVLEDNR